MFLSFKNASAPAHRRFILAGLNLLLLTLGAAPIAGRLSYEGWSIPGMILFALYVVLLAQVVYGFTVAVTGWWLLRRGGDPLRINNSLPPDAVTDDLPPIAVVMPIYNENVERVFRGLRVMYESLQATSQGRSFDFYVLSDSSDLNLWIEEEKAWFELCRQVQGFGHIFYRKRRVPLHHKSGNIADFCRRWGAKYRYLIVLDADSVMAGPTFVRLASLMERHPKVGIIQTCPRLALGESLFQRINQFLVSICGPIFSAGAGFWQLDGANFWGHNAIIRLKPFIRHCALPELPKAGPLGRRILSHDTVEAAFMRRAGYEVWSAYDLEGTYEESPPHLLASLQRDYRWCYGNLQHTWFLFARGLKAISRLNILLGIMAYVSSPLWFCFLLLSPLLFIGGDAPDLPAWERAGTLLSFGYVMWLLLTPKALGAMWLARSAEKLQACGGRRRLALNVFVETIFSMTLAPILMLFHTQFVVSLLLGAGVQWNRQKRAGDESPSWRELTSTFFGHTLLALMWAGLLAWLEPSWLPWMALILFGPILAIPFCRVTSSNSLGLRTKNQGWFLIPEETNPPPELKALLNPAATPSTSRLQDGDGNAPDGLAAVFLDPYVNAIHVSLLNERTRTAIRSREYLARLGDRLLLEGPGSLAEHEMKALLWDADSMLSLHRKLWNRPAPLLDRWPRAASQRFHGFDTLEARRPGGETVAWKQ